MTFTKVVTVKNTDGSYKDLSTYTARLQLRESPESATTILSLTSPSVAGLGIDLNLSGQVTIKIPAATTALLDFYLVHYDLEIVSAAGEVTRVIKGRCALSREVTK